MLAYYDHLDYFGIDKRGTNYDVSERLRRLYNIRDAVLSYIDQDKRGDMDNVRLVRAISVWINAREKTEFFQYLRETGLYEESFSAYPAFAWVLVGTKTNDWKAKMAAQNKSTADNWRVDIAASEGSATFTHTYLGKDDSWMKQGMSQSGQVTWTTPSDSIISPNEEFSVHLTVTHLQNEHAYRAGGWMGLAQVFNIDESGAQKGSAMYLCDREGGTSFTSGSGNKFQSFSPTVYGTFGAGSEGDWMAIRVSASGGGSVETSYIYAWRPAP